MNDVIDQIKENMDIIEGGGLIDTSCDNDSEAEVEVNN